MNMEKQKIKEKTVNNRQREEKRKKSPYESVWKLSAIVLINIGSSVEKTVFLKFSSRRTALFSIRSKFATCLSGLRTAAVPIGSVSSCEIRYFICIPVPQTPTNVYEGKKT